jgi:hypothetical protein
MIYNCIFLGYHIPNTADNADRCVHRYRHRYAAGGRRVGPGPEFELEHKCADADADADRHLLRRPRKTNRHGVRRG